MDRLPQPWQNPSIPAPLDHIIDEYDIHQHELPFEEREPSLVDYVPDIKGTIEGDDAL